MPAAAIDRGRKMEDREMTRVAVTGGSGKLGTAVVADLVGHGYDVVNLDRIPSADPRSPFVEVDLADYGQTLAALLAVTTSTTASTPSCTWPRFPRPV